MLKWTIPLGRMGHPAARTNFRTTLKTLGGRMAAYVIVDIQITDPKTYETYKEKAASSLAAFGGRYLARGGTVETLEGTWKPGRTVILEFPSAQRAREWWGSEQYAPIKAIRHASATTQMVLVEGAEAPSRGEKSR